jgi:hypothetical protein
LCYHTLKFYQLLINKKALKISALCKLGIVMWITLP